MTEDSEKQQTIFVWVTTQEINPSIP